MPKAKTITMRIDNDLKCKAELLCEDMGLSLSSAFTLFLKALVRTRSIPFKIEASDPFFSSVNQKKLLASIEELEAGKSEEHDLIDA